MTTVPGATARASACDGQVIVDQDDIRAEELPAFPRFRVVNVVSMTADGA